MGNTPHAYVPRPRRWPALVAALALGGCDEASVSVTFDVPDAYREQVDDIVLRVLVPPVDERDVPAFGCDDVALGRVATADLLLGQVQEVTASPRGVELSGIPRVGEKLFWLEARDGQSLPVAAGCAPLGDVIGQAVVAVDAEPTKVVAFDNLPEFDFASVSTPLPDEIGLVVTDATGLPLAGVAVEWQVVGMAAQIHTTDSQQADDRGQATIHLGRQVDPATIPGPMLLDVAVRWARTPLPNVGGFGQLPLLVPLTELDDGAASDQSEVATKDRYAVGRIGPQGEMGFVVLGPSQGDPSSRAIQARYYDPNAGVFREVSAATPVLAADHIATVTRGGREIAIVASAAGLIELGVGAGGITRLPPVGIGGVPEGMVAVGPCEGDSDQLLVLLRDMVPSSRMFRVFASTGAEVLNTPFTSSALGVGRLVSSGCVSGPTGELIRTVVYGRRFDEGGDDNAFRQAVVADTGTRRETLWANFAVSAGFTPALGGQPAYLLGSDLDIEGASLVRYNLTPLGAGALELQPVVANDLFTFAHAMHGGDFDGDGLVDLAALMEIVGDRNREAYRVQLILGAQFEGQPVVGLSFGLPLDDAHLFVADFDGDGADDALLAGRNEYAVVAGVPR